MGACCSSTSAAADAHAPAHASAGYRAQANFNGGGNRAGNARAVNRSPVAQPSNAEKRQRAAEAAEARQRDWRQGGHVDPEKAQAQRQRQVKDELLAKIYNRYHALGKEAPIGLPSCDIDQLRRHYASLGASS